MKLSDEFWNGDRWYPELLARGRATNGRPVLLKSEQLTSLAGLHVTGSWKDYDYYVPLFYIVDAKIQTVKFPEKITIAVLDDSGTELGNEEILLHLETRRFLRAETP